MSKAKIKARRKRAEAKSETKGSKKDKGSNQKTVTKDVPVRLEITLNADGTVAVNPPYTHGFPDLVVARGMAEEAIDVMKNEDNYRYHLAGEVLRQRAEKRAKERRKRGKSWSDKEKKRLNKAERKREK